MVSMSKIGRGGGCGCREEIADLRSRLDAATRRAEEVENALAFYADRHLYYHIGDSCPAACDDEGATARAALARIDALLKGGERA